MDSLGGYQAREINFVSMAAFPSNNRSKLLQIRGVEGNFPFYGEIESEPMEAAQDFQTKNAALVDATTMLQLGQKIGDSIKIGQVTLPIIGKLNGVPGSSSIFSSISPPVVIPYAYIEKSGLVQTGSRIDYEFYFKNSEIDLVALDQKVDPVLDDEQADLDTHLSTSQRLGERYDNFGKFLNLVAFIALLLGCVGIASAIYIYIREKIKSIAVLKCLGASKQQSFMIFLIQVCFIGLIGGILGSTLGVVLQHFFPWLLKGLLPVEVEITFAWPVIIMGIILGIFMSVLFALLPLIETLYISPLQALRVIRNQNSKSKRAIVLVSSGILIFIFLFSLWLVEEYKYAFAFVGGLIVSFGILTLLGILTMRLVKKYYPKSLGFVARQSLLNLYRPQNQTLILILSIGLGTFLMSTLYFTKDLILAQARIDDRAGSPNVILLDVQSNQRQALVNTIEQNDLEVLRDVPIVSMRIHSINGTSVNEIRRDSTSTINPWVLRHEFRTTYRDSLIISETIREGEWVNTVEDDDVVPVSVGYNFSKDANIALGDELVFNVQGVLLKTVIKSIRDIDWTRMDLNFNVVFPEGVLDQAPQFRVMTTKVPDQFQSAKLQQELVTKFPNVSIIDLRQMLSVVEDLLSKISWIINFMAFFSILTGIIVLIGAIRTSKYQRTREGVLLRTLGAKSKQILNINALEYIYLGVLGSLTGVLLSLVSSQLLAIFVFDSAFVPSSVPFLVLFPGIVFIILIIGLSSSISIIKKPPLVVLRKEA
jgi:putative ABC transport system permease protein